MTGPHKLVYFVKPIGMDGPIKIGCSQAVYDRLESLCEWCPFPLEILTTVLGGPDLEQNIHECLADIHLHHEWFRPAPKLLEIIRLLQDGYRIADVIDLSARIGRIKAVRGVYDRERILWRKRQSHRMNYFAAIRRYGPGQTVISRPDQGDSQA